MTRDEIIRMVKEIAGSDLENATVAEKVLDEIVPLCTAVAAWNGWQAGAAAERERCAKVCEEIERKKWKAMRDGGKLEGVSPRDCAAEIRRMK